METSPDEFARRFPELDLAFTELHAELLEAIAKTPTAATAEREQIYYSLRGLDAARSKMIAHIDARKLKEHAATLATPGEATA